MNYLLSLFSLYLTISLVSGHGFTIFPPSKVYMCNKNPNNNIWWPQDGSGIQDAQCRAAYQHVYKRNGEVQQTATVQFVQANEFAIMIPDYDQGYIALTSTLTDNLCSAGANDSTHNFGDKSGFSIPFQWPTTTIKAKNHMATIDFDFCATAVHNPSYWEVYLSKDSYDLSSSNLTWDDLELVAEIGNILPTQNSDAGCPSSNSYKFKVEIPSRQKDATILLRWQRDDSAGECFIQCSDVHFEV